MTTENRTLRRIAETAATLFALMLLVAAPGCFGGGDEQNLVDSGPAKKSVDAAKDAAKATEEAVEKTADAASEKAAEKAEKAIEKTTEIKMETLVERSEALESAGGTYSYDPINKVDPFAQFTATSELPTLGGADENVLTKYEIRYFRLVGIVADEAQPRAIFEDPRGRAYVVAVGTPIGRNLGVIEQILADSVVVNEQRIVPGGDEPESVKLVIKLHPEREKES